MPENLLFSEKIHIYLLTDREPFITISKGSPAPVIVQQDVDSKITPAKWIITRVNNDTVTFTTDGYQAREDKGVLYAYEDMSEIFMAKYIAHQDAYIIQKLTKNGLIGWTAPHPDENTNAVTLEPFVVTRSIPPQHIGTQLFRFLRIERND